MAARTEPAAAEKLMAAKVPWTIKGVDDIETQVEEAM